jgi:hypothetical protein
MILFLIFKKLIQQPSVSAKNEGIEECAKLVQKIIKKHLALNLKF